MTYYDLIAELKNCALEEPNVRFVGSKDIYELNSIPEIEYDVFYITPNSFTLNENTIEYSLNLYYVSRWDETDDNQNLIQSIGIITLQNIINRFINRNEDIVLRFPISFQTFYQKFKDMCAGVYATVTFTTDNILGVCNE